MKTTSDLINKWEPLLEAEDAPKIRDSYRKGVIAHLLENQEEANAEELPQLNEAAGAGNTTSVSNVQNWDPILISLVRRAMPNLIAFDTAGVQPMNGPTGQIFALKSLYKGKYDSGSPAGYEADTEALRDEANTAFSGTGTHDGNPSGLGQTGFDGSPADSVAADPLFSFGVGMSTETAETLGGEGGKPWGEMGFTIEQATVTAKSRGLKAEYTIEMAQDLKKIHGLEAEDELANILSTEIMAEINREYVRTVNSKAKLGRGGHYAPIKGVFDLASDADGRWAAEKFKSLVFELDREANAIAKDTRRGKGNWIICSSNVASALSASGQLDYTPAMATALNVDDTGNTFAGVLNGSIRVYIDPYAIVDYVTVGYRGTSPYDAGIFYCPYIPLGLLRAINQETFQPKIGFKTRYGMATNPFNKVGINAERHTLDTGDDRANKYFRIFRVDNINVGTGV